MIYKALNGWDFIPARSIALPVSHRLILLARFQHLNWDLHSRKNIWATNKKQKRKSSVFQGVLSAEM